MDAILGNNRKMKTTIISLKTTSIILAITGFAVSVQAVPTQITGTISFSGTSSINGASFLEATRFTLFQDVFVGAPSALSGDYIGTSGAPVTLMPFIWAPPTASTPLNPLWTFASSGNVYSFDLNALHVDFVSPTGLLLSGLGSAYITGPGVEKLRTSGYWNFSAQTLDVATFTFSSTTTSPAQETPDGGLTVAMLGVSIFGLCLVGRKQMISKGL